LRDGLARGLFRLPRFRDVRGKRDAFGENDRMRAGRRTTDRVARGAIYAVVALLLATVGAIAAPQPTHGLSYFGELKYGPDFKHFDYVNASAPKGGTLRMAAMGTFDSLNGFVLKGNPAAGLGLIYDTLMTPSSDEPGAEYGLVAQSVTVPADRSWVEFALRPEARWHDGQLITPEDVIFSFETLKRQGRPFFRMYYANVAKVEKTGPHSVRFTFAGTGNRELPQILGQLPILPKHYWAKHKFDATTLHPPLGSGPYEIGQVQPGRSITYVRVKDYWGRNLPVNVGRYNFDAMRFDYYRDDSIALQAFKAGRFDLRVETGAKNWATAYDVPAVRQGLIQRVVLKTALPEPMQAFVLNLRRAKYADPRVREALDYAFDFEWTNKTLFYGQYTRVESYFANSELAATGLPSAGEKALLEPFKADLPPELFERPYAEPHTDGSGTNRKNLRVAQALLNQAGFQVRDGVLVDKAGNPFTIEFLLNNPAFERVIAPYQENLRRLGIRSTIRQIDSAQYENRLRDFDFDCVVGNFPESLSPGNEQRAYWGSTAADRPGSENIAGIKDKVVDALIDKVIYAKDRDALVTATHALDRVLLWRHYMIPQWYMDGTRIAYWDRFAFPEPPKYDIGLPDLWWFEQAKAKDVDRRAPALTKPDGQ
jgi:microcin C transport system substrate-binding protein